MPNTEFVRNFNSRFTEKWGHLFNSLSHVNIEVSDMGEAQEVLDALDTLTLCPYGVYTRWNDCSYRDEEDMVDQLSGDRGALYAALKGWIVAVPYPYIENTYTGSELQTDSVKEIAEMVEWLRGYDEKGYATLPDWEELENDE